MAEMGSISIGSLVLPDGSKVKFLTTVARAHLASKRANLMPMQFRGPCPNGKNAYGFLLALFSLEKFSGLNSKGES